MTKMCWTLCYKKNICTKHLLITDEDCFKVWCIFNFLSEDKYPLVIVTEEVRKDHCKGKINIFEVPSAEVSV